MRRTLKYYFYLYFFCILAFQSCSDHTGKIAELNTVYDYGYFFTKGQHDSIDIFLKDIVRNGFLIPVVATHFNDAQVNADSLSKNTFMRIFGKTDKAGKSCFIFFSTSTREVRVKLGEDISKNINDSIIQKVVDLNMVPHFKENSFYNGIVSGVTQIENIISEN